MSLVLHVSKIGYDLIILPCVAGISRSNASLWQLHLFVSTTASCECAFSALPVLGLLTSVIQPLLSLQVESRV